MPDKPLSAYRTAIVYDWLTEAHGGAERVLTALHQAFPQATLFASVHNPQQANWANRWQIKTTWLQKIPVLNKYHRSLGLLMPLAFEALDLSRYELVISVTSLVAKGIITKPHQLHLCYLLTPPRYLYSHQQLYWQHYLKIPLFNKLVKPAIKYWRWWDQAAAYRPDQLIPISQLVSNRITQFYHRQPQPVIYPPVTMPGNHNDSAELQLEEYRLRANQYLLVVARLVGYKKIDLAIKACLRLKQPLVIVGEGPEKAKLKQSASGQKFIKFLDQVTENKLKILYNNCLALIMPGVEDFGITALEANAHGKPVIINQHSGAAELIKNKQHGLHLSELSVKAVIAGIDQLKKHSFQASKLRQNAANYDTTKFVAKFRKITRELLKKHKERLNDKS